MDTPRFRRTLPPGTLVHLGGIPVELRHATEILTTAGHWALIEETLCSVAEGAQAVTVGDALDILIHATPHPHETGMRCPYCHQDRTTADSCMLAVVVYPDGTRLRPSTDHCQEPTGRCHDCGIRHGGIHHPGCAVEWCPRCGHQLLSCWCLTGVFSEGTRTLRTSVDASS